MSVPLQEGILRLYDNGDVKGGLKFFVNKGLANGLGIVAGDRFTLIRDRHGVLTLTPALTPAVVELRAERDAAIALPDDPFLAVFRETGQRKDGGQFHAMQACPQVRGNVTRSRQDAARLAGAHRCTLCWILPSAPGVAA